MTATKTVKPKKTKDETKQERREAETRKLNAEAEQYEAAAQLAKIEAEDAVYSWKARTASDYHNRIYHFNKPVDSSSVANCQSTLAAWHRMHPGEDIEIVFHSPGGSVFDGMALFDYIQYLRAAGHHVTTTCRGIAASMGGILLQAGDRRVMGRESYVLIHEISTSAYGKIGDLKDEVAFMEKIGERVIQIFVSRSGGKLTAAQLKKAWKKTDYWLDSVECVKFGLVDEVV